MRLDLIMLGAMAVARRSSGCVALTFVSLVDCRIFAWVFEEQTLAMILLITKNASLVIGLLITAPVRKWRNTIE